jgi:hypothetical protein
MTDEPHALESHPFAPLVAAVRAAFDDVDVVMGEAPDELDLRVSTTIASHPAHVVIECRDSRRRDQLAWIVEPHSHGERPVDKLVLVSRLPFSSASATEAGRRAFELHTLAEALADPGWARGLVRQIAVSYLERAEVVLTFTLADPEVASRRTGHDEIVGAGDLGVALHRAWRKLRDQESSRVGGPPPSLVELAKRRRVRFGLPATLPPGCEYRVGGSAAALSRVSAEVTWWCEAAFPERSRALLLAVGVPSTEPLRVVTDISCVCVGAATRVTVVEDAEGQRLLVYPPHIR